MDTKRLALLRDELVMIALWDTYEPAGSDSYLPRRRREEEIVAEIRRLSQGRGEGNGSANGLVAHNGPLQAQVGRASLVRRPLRGAKPSFEIVFPSPTSRR